MRSSGSPNARSSSACVAAARHARLPSVACSPARHAARPVRAHARCQAMNADSEDFLTSSHASSMEMTTILCSDGRIVQLPGRTIKKPRQEVITPMPSWEDQKLCIGASFTLAATNGRNPSRRVNLVGFCQSIDYLFDSIQGSVHARRGEILWQERELKSGLHETLRLIVAVPQLFGVPQQLQLLSDAIASGGGVVHHTYHEWNFYK